MHGLHLTITLAGLGVAAIIGYDFISQYVKSANTGFQRIWDAGRGSATMVVAQLGAVAAGMVMAGDKVTDLICGILNTPDAATQIKADLAQYMTGQNLGIAMLVFTALVAWARSRSMGKN